MDDLSDPGLDPEVAEALRLLASDPELRAWYERSRAFDTLVASRLREIRPPADLEASLLAGLRLSAPRRLWGFRPRSLLLAGVGLAAAAAVAAAALVLVPQIVGPGGGGETQVAQAESAAADPGRAPAFPLSSPSLEEFRSEILATLAGLRDLEYMSSTPAEVDAWLRERSAPLEGGIPERAGDHLLVGCSLLEWRGHRISLVCFRLPGEEGPPGLHLVVIDAAALGPFAPEDRAAPVEAVSGDWSTAIWSRDGTVRLAIAKGERSDLRRLVPLG